MFITERKMQVLYVRVVKARNLPAGDAYGSLDLFVEINIQNYIRITKNIIGTQNLDWNMVFAFSMEEMRASSVLEVRFKSNHPDGLIGKSRFDLNDVPTARVPPNSRWYQLRHEEKECKVEALLAVWIDNQTDKNEIGHGHGNISMWNNPVITVLLPILFIVLANFPELILTTILCYMFLIKLCRFRFRTMYPENLNARLTRADSVNLGDENDMFPAGRISKPFSGSKYDLLKSVAELSQSLLSLRDPYAATFFATICLLAAAALYLTPLPLLVALERFLQLQ